MRSRLRFPLLPRRLSANASEFLRERHLATLTSLRPDSSPHVVPVGFTWDPDRRLARVITDGSSVKARLAAAGGRVALCQVDGRRWITLEGTSAVSGDRERVAEPVARYAERYRTPRENPNRVVIDHHRRRPRFLGPVPLLTAYRSLACQSRPPIAKPKVTAALGIAIFRAGPRR
jgi:PPOX class probable F420-dependent enzyme